MPQCEDTKNICQTQDSKETICPVEKSVSQTQCPIEAAIEMWQSAFFEAMHEVQVDILKEKIRKNWGDLMEKKGDAIIESMGTHWQTVLQQAKAKVDLRENFMEIIKQASQK